MTQNPLDPFLKTQGCIVLDGGLATELEARGHDLNDRLWSARLLLDDPQAVRQVHLNYLRAGADCIVTATYQASLQGFRARGLTAEEGTAHLERAVALAVEARDQFWSDSSNHEGRLRPLVTASVGPYGAYLADGSEYSGDYGLTRAELAAFHRERWEILAAAGADLLGCETIPSAIEAEVLLELLGGTPDVWAWISFSCADGEHISDGSRMEDVARLCDSSAQVAAVGANCSAPVFIDSLIGESAKGTTKPILVYPNSGETYDAQSKTWTGASEAGWWRRAPETWIDLGAAGVGGCCRVGPAEITEVRKLLLE